MHTVKISSFENWKWNNLADNSVWRTFCTNWLLQLPSLDFQKKTASTSLTCVELRSSSNTNYSVDKTFFTIKSNKIMSQTLLTELEETGTIYSSEEIITHVGRNKSSYPVLITGRSHFPLWIRTACCGLLKIFEREPRVIAPSPFRFLMFCSQTWLFFPAGVKGRKWPTSTSLLCTHSPWLTHTHA